MKSQTIELRARIQTLTEEMASINEEMRAEGITDDELNALQARFDANEAAIKRLERQLKNEARAAELAARMQATEETELQKKGVHIDTGKTFRFSLSKAILQYRTHGQVDTGLEGELCTDAHRRNVELSAKVGGLNVRGIHLPDNYGQAEEHRAMQVAVGSAGGSTVSLEKMGWLENLTAMAVLPTMGVTQLTGLTGDVDLNRGSAAGVTTKSEIADADDYNQQTDVAALRPTRQAAHQDVSFQLLAQSSVDIDAMLLREFQRSMSAKIDLEGIAKLKADTEVLEVGNAAGQALNTAAWPIITSMPNAVGNANVVLDNTGAFLGGYALKANLQGTFRDTGTGIPFMSELGNQLIGYNYNATSQMDLTQIVAGNDDLFFGAWSYLYLGSWGSPIVTIDETSQAIKGMLRLVINSYIGWAVGRGQAFAKAYFTENTLPAPAAATRTKPTGTGKVGK